jgi:hypothetical protein
MCVFTERMYHFRQGDTVAKVLLRVRRIYLNLDIPSTDTHAMRRCIVIYQFPLGRTCARVNTGIF